MRLRKDTEMKRGVLEPEPGVVICIWELPNTFFSAYRILPNSTRFDLQVSGPPNVPIKLGVKYIGSLP